MNYNLGKLEKKTNLREVWKNEATDFTKWLAKENNIKLLSEELGFNITVDETEASTGRYNVDIKAHEEETDKTIIIENQLEMTNHDHLGKVIVYSAGFDADIQIWIVKDVRDEHKQAVDWLNEHSDEHINIFLVQIELWKIGDSQIAPKFQIISKPNNWAKAIRKNVSKNMSNASTIQLNFWEDFKNYCEEKKVSFSLIKPLPQHWYNIFIGSSDCHLDLTYNTKKHEIACELYINDNKDLYYSLEKYKGEINNAISHNLDWMALEGKKASRIKLVSNLDVDPNMESWDEAFEWMSSTVELFKNTFKKYLK